jgi:hypothetical protein
MQRPASACAYRLQYVASIEHISYLPKVMTIFPYRKFDRQLLQIRRHFPVYCHPNNMVSSPSERHTAKRCANPCLPSYLALRAGPPLYAIIYKKRHIGILATFTQVAYTSSRHPPHHVPSQESRIWTQEASFNATFPSHDRNGIRQRPQLSFQDRCPNGDVGTSSHEPHCVRLCLQCNSIAQLDGSAMMLRM